MQRLVLVWAVKFILVVFAIYAYTCALLLL
jgi:hypothetical protein